MGNIHVPVKSSNESVIVLMEQIKDKYPEMDEEYANQIRGSLENIYSSQDKGKIAALVKTIDGYKGDLDALVEAISEIENR